MAWVEKYSCTFKDCLNQTWVVYLDEDGGGAGSTALTPDAVPLRIVWGQPGQDIYDPILPSYAELRFIASAATVVEDLFGDDESKWRMRVDKAGGSIWQGAVNTDVMDIPLDHVGTYSVFAVDGLARLDGYDFTTAGRTPFIEGIADALQNIACTTYEIHSLCNWHAYDGGATVQGDSMARYRFDGDQTEDLETTDDFSARYVLEQLAGRFACRVFMGTGVWVVQQREKATGTLTYTRYTYAGAAVGGTTLATAVTLGTNSELLATGGVIRGVLPYYEVSARYLHNSQGDNLFTNADFENGSGTPTGWTKGGSRTVERRPVIWNTEIGSIYSTFIAANPAGAGADLDVEFDTSVSQTGLTISGGGGGGFSTKITFDCDLDFKAANIYTSDQPFAWAYAIQPTSGTTQWWDDAGGQWLDTGVVYNKEFLKYNEPATLTRETTENPTAGLAWIAFYNAVETTATTGILDGVRIDRLKVDVIGDNDTVSAETLTTVVDTASGNSVKRPTDEFIFGQGPTDTHLRRITWLDGTEQTASNWKSGAYAGPPTPDASTTFSMDNMYVRQVLSSRRTNRKRLMCDFRATSTLFQHNPSVPLVYDSVTYSCEYLEFDAAAQNYRFEGTAIEATALSSPSVVETTVFPVRERRASNTLLPVSLNSQAAGQVLRYDGTNYVNSADPVRLLFAQTATATHAAGGEATLTSTGEGSLTLPADALTAGAVVYLKAEGLYTDDASGASLTIKFKVGGTTILTSATTVPDNGTANLRWRAECTLTARTGGATGTFFAQGWVDIASSLTDSYAVPLRDTAVTTGVDMTTTLAVDLTATWSTTSQSISCTNLNLYIATAG